MADRTKVEKGLARCLSGKVPFGCGECPYYGDEVYTDAWSCRLSLMRDANELLKEQQPIEPVEMDLCNGEPFCPTCGSIVRCYYNFCVECGQKFKKDSEGYPIFVGDDGKRTGV